MCTKQYYDFFFWSNEKYKRVCIFDKKYEYDMHLTLDPIQLSINDNE